MIKWQDELESIANSSWPEPDPVRSISDKGIILYGAGDMGHMAMDFLTAQNIIPLKIVDKSKQGCVSGIEISKPQDISAEEKENCTFIVCIATINVKIINDYLHELGCVDIRHFYDLSEILFPETMPNGWYCKDPEIEKLEKIIKLLEHDPCSVAHYLQFLWWRVRRQEVIYDQYPVLSGKKFFKAPCMPALTEMESLLDGGAHHGQTIEAFIDITDNKYSKIWAFEPDKDNYKELTEKNIDSGIELSDDALSDLPEIFAFQSGLGYASKIDLNGDVNVNAISIDSLNINPTIIKLHIEGEELKALNGAKETIERSRPVIMVLADHTEDGLFKIPSMLSAFDNYKLYFCLHDYCGNTAIWYAIPEERVTSKK